VCSETEPAGPFGLDEEKAREFTRRAVERFHADGELTGDHDSWETVTIGPGWNPRRLEAHEMREAEDFIAQAVNAGAIICPDGWAVQLDCMPDGEGGVYLWRITLPADAGFSLASDYLNNARHLGDGSTGIAGALGLLREAVTDANRIYAAYTMAAERHTAALLLRKLRGRAPEAEGTRPRDIAGLLNGWLAANGLTLGD
jgi:hypothetical protein